MSVTLESARTSRDEVVLEIARDPALVRTVRLVAAAFARRNGLTEDVVEDVRLAVGEACAVMIGTEEDTVAGAEVSQGVLAVRLAAEGGGVHVEVSGSTGPQQEVLSDLGLDPWSIMRGLFDEGSVEERRDGVTVRLTWES